MFKTRTILIALLAAGSSVMHSDAGTAVGTTFTYQGRLTQAGTPFDGTVDVEFSLHDAITAGNQVGTTLSIVDLIVEDGLVTTDLDFGAGAFNGTSRWLEITIDATTLSPRQPVLPTPYAIRAQTIPPLSVTTEIINASAVTSDKLATDATSLSKVSGGMVQHHAATGFIGINTATPEGRLHLSGLGETHLLIEADTNNGGGEDQNARIIMRQDGGLVSSRIGYRQSQNKLEIIQEDDDDLILGTNGVDRLTIDADGAVGIGTSPNSGRALTINGINANDSWLQFRSMAGVDQWHLSSEGGGLNFVESGVAANRLVLKDGGGVAIGTTDTSVGRFVVKQSANDSANGMTVMNTSSTRTGRFWVDDSDVARLDSATFGDGPLTINGGGGTVRLVGSSGGPHIEMAQSGTGAQLVMYNDSGVQTFTLDSADGDGDAFFRLRNKTGAMVVEMLTESADDGSVRVKNGAGATVIELDGDFNGEGRIFTEVLEITGGSDLSEQFGVTSNDRSVEPGDVVCIDAHSSGSLTLSMKDYDRTVAGVISGAGGVRTGMLMGQRDSIADGAYPVALTGRVYVKVDASFGAVRPGDLLTTAPTAGHAMVVVDHDRASGAILGKAMTSLEEGRGLVLVLVSLQ